ncbi:MAG: MFS transporter [Planctomycetota bacterium]
MSPLQVAIDSVGRAVASFHPRSVPLMMRSHYRRELAAWLFLPIMLGAVEGGVVAVVVKSYFETVVGLRGLNLAVAVLAGSPAFANVVSFLWAAASHGRPKVRFLAALQVAVCGCVAAVALAPQSAGGLWLFVTAVVAARVCWSGVVTLRSTIWRANYPRHTRARLAGRLATVQSLVMTAAALGLGAAMQVSGEAFRVVLPVAGCLGLVGAWLYRGLRVRGERLHLRAERAHVDGNGVSPLALRQVLLGDDRFRRYMTCMFVFGTGNLMVTAPLVIILRDRFAFEPLRAILIVMAVPTLLMPLAIPLWSRLLDRVHIIRFRAFHSWTFASSTACLLTGALALEPALLWAGAILKGAAFGGGILAWNLGHHDFSSSERASQYMGIHVTLTGVRGLLAPIIGVSLYEILEWLNPGSGAWALAPCLALTCAGAIGFLAMHRTLEGPGVGGRFEDGPPVVPPAAT